MADHVNRRGRIAAGAQARAVEYHERLAVERQVGPVRAVYRLGFQQT
jgi:hypothetical protein